MPALIVTTAGLWAGGRGTASRLAVRSRWRASGSPPRSASPDWSAPPPAGALIRARSLGRDGHRALERGHGLGCRTQAHGNPGPRMVMRLGDEGEGQAPLAGSCASRFRSASSLSGATADACRGAARASGDGGERLSTAPDYTTAQHSPSPSVALLIKSGTHARQKAAGAARAGSQRRPDYHHVDQRQAGRAGPGAFFPGLVHGVAGFAALGIVDRPGRSEHQSGRSQESAPPAALQPPPPAQATAPLGSSTRRRRW